MSAVSEDDELQSVSHEFFTERQRVCKMVYQDLGEGKLEGYSKLFKGKEVEQKEDNDLDNATF